MKVIIAFAAIVVATSALTVEEADKLLSNAYDQCQADQKTQADIDIVDAAFEGKPYDRDVFGRLALCTAQKADVISEDGRLNKDVLEYFLESLIADQKKLETVKRECEVPQKTQQDTAIQAFLCVDRALPPHKH